MNTWTIFFIFLTIAFTTNGRQHEIPREFFRSVLPEEVSSRPRGKTPSEGTTPLIVWPSTTTEWLKDSTTTDSPNTDTTIEYTTELATTTTTDDVLTTNSTEYQYSIEESETTTLVSTNTTENEYKTDFSSELPTAIPSTIPTPTTTEETTETTTETTIETTVEITSETTAETTTEATVETTTEHPGNTPDYNYIATSIEQEDYFNTDGILASIEVSTIESTSPITIENEFTETTTEKNFKLRMIPSPNVTPSSMAVNVNRTDNKSNETNATGNLDNNIGVIAGATTGAVLAVLISILLFIWWRRKKGREGGYGRRCRPVSLDTASVCGSVAGGRRKGVLRTSGRVYGNAAFESYSKRIRADAPTINAALAHHESLDREFQQIPQIRCSASELPPEAEPKNRYANVLPLPETRVPLGNGSYINASYVTNLTGSSKAFIACQAPLQNTCADHWQMVWEQQAKAILMLTDLVESGMERCADYLPASEVLDCRRRFGDFQITLLEREADQEWPCVLLSRLRLMNLETGSFREVRHVWLSGGWPCPAAAVLRALELAQSAVAPPGESPGPLVVHCNNGTGRTGSILSLALCCSEMDTTGFVDVPQIVHSVRRQRAGAVQTRQQYILIYEALAVKALLSSSTLEATLQ